MKKILLLAVLALALPTALFAGSSVDFTNSGGMLSGSSSGLTLSGSTLIVRRWRMVHYHRQRHQRNSQRHSVFRNF
jgi:hypothetical protein